VNRDQRDKDRALKKLKTSAVFNVIKSKYIEEDNTYGPEKIF